MKTILGILIILVAVWSCGQKSSNHDDQAHHASEPIKTSGNEALYLEVMKVHDEVMPKMNDIYNLKMELSKKIEDSATLALEKKGELETTIAKLDSANEGMMIWMRQFDPMPDSLGEEKAREYLENEMEKVKKVRSDILAALDKGKEAAGK